MRFGIIGIERDRLTVAGGGVLQLSIFTQCIAQIVVSLREARLDLNCPAILSSGLINPSQIQKRIAEIAMEVGKTGLQSDALADEIHGNLIFSELMRDDSQQMQRAAMARPHRENLPVYGLGLSQSSRLVVLDRIIKGLQDVH